MGFLEDLHAALESEQRLSPRRVCEILAERWGGERPYIGKRLDAQRPDQGDTVQALVARGVPRRTAYNWVNKWRR